MMNVALRWIVPLTTLLILGPIAGYFTASLQAPDGSHDASLLTSSSISQGLIAGGIVMFFAATAGLTAARFISPCFGLFCAGLVLMCGAFGTGNIDQIVRATPVDHVISKLSIEGAILLLPAVMLAWAIVVIGKPPTQHPSSTHPPHIEPKVIKDIQVFPGLLVAMAVGSVIVWILARESLKGQTFAAAAFAGLGAAAAGRLAAIRVSAAVFIAALAILAAVSPLAALYVHGSSEKVALAAQGDTLFALVRPLPLDYLAGAFIGVPLGLTWAASMLHPHHLQQAVRS